MITDKELLISNKSYTNKDFASIYPEEIDIFKKMTNRYDPETSNESDPMIVNLKTNAFIADKLCYNIDKNVLENYMPSATQESSMSDLCSRLGYDMKYYTASATDIYIKYTGTAFNDVADGGVEGAHHFTIDRFTEITSNDGEIIFTTTQSKQYDKFSNYITIPALQGVLKDLVVADSKKIQLENLNSQNRIYFNESLVAENGVFVTSIDDGTEWSSVNNLNLVLPNTPCFKFGYDSVNRWPYIEFPEDIASLIGSGLNIKYLVTQGDNGNVNANYLTKIQSSEGFKLCDNDNRPVKNSDGEDAIVSTDSESSDLIIKNISASIGGSNPESIDEAYNNFKKTIGTFDTLVTCRDYANAIYNLYDSDNLYAVVSNCQVSDRRDDINYMNKVLTLDTYGTNYIYANSDISAFDLCLYPLSPIKSYTAEYYVNSFKPLKSLNYIKSSIENSKSISHDYKKINDSDVYALKNYYKLNVKLTTTYKVTQYERVTIIANVLNALIKKFNAREVDYGEELSYDIIVNTIQNADERISYVSMAEPDLVTYFMLGNGEEVNSTTDEGRTYYLKLLAKNILAGRVSLLDLYDAFTFDFNQTDGTVIDNLASIESVARITLENNESYDLKKHEAIQVIGPSFVTTIPYGYGIRYHYKGARILEKEEHELGANESLVVRYKPSGENRYVVIEYKPGEIIKPSFELTETPAERTSTNGVVVAKGVGGVDTTFAMLSSDETIDIRKLNMSKLDGFTYCYWIRNNSQGNTLFTESDFDSTTNRYQVMLQDGDYFFYKKSLKEDYISLGSGTILTIDKSLKDNNNWSIDNIDIDEIISNGADAIKWVNIIFNNEHYLTAQETTILTVAGGDSIQLISNANESGTESFTSITLNNDLQLLPEDVTVSYKIAGGKSEELGLIKLDRVGDEYKWKIKSRLDINAGPDNVQVLDENQTVKFISSDGTESEEFDEGYCIELNNNQQFIGSDNIVVSSYDITELNPSQRIKYPLSAYVFKYVDSVDSISQHRNSTGFINLRMESSEGESGTYIYKLYFTDTNQEFTEGIVHFPMSTKRGILTIYCAGIEEDNTVKLTATGGNIKIFNTSNIAQSTLNLAEGINVIDIGVGVTSISIESDNIYYPLMCNIAIDKISYLSDNEDISNKSLGLKDGELTSLLKDINDIDVNHQFYYNAPLSKDDLIESDDLSSPYSLYDYNNIANKFTISEIDISSSGSIIDVVKTSMLS